MKQTFITLLTDFGTKDHYVASMKGVILRINPQCTLIDITHHVRPQDIREGAFVLSNACAFFPKGTIHLAVVDPGVGSRRNPVLIQTDRYFFVGPDNGLFTLALKRERVKKVVALKNSKFFLSRISTTFHGRDLFAPVAAYLSLGVRPGEFGNELDSWVELDLKQPQAKRGELLGEILHIDDFGNLISNIDEEQLSDWVGGHSFVSRVGGKTIKGLKKGYWEGKPNGPMALIGSGGFLEISVRESSAQKLLKVKKGDPIRVSKKFPAYRQAGKPQIPNKHQ
jgi:S-adenosylmethionine hydrolase